MDPSYEAFVAWARANPGLLVTVAFAVPALIGAVGALLSRGGASQAAPAIAPPEPVARPEPTPEPPPVAERVPAPEPEPVEEVAAEPEPAAVPEPEPVPEPEAAPPAPPPARLRDRLRLTSDALVGRLGTVLGGRTVDAELLDDLEALLYGADLGVKTAEGLLQTVRAKASGRDAAAVEEVLRDAIFQRLKTVEPDPNARLAGSPHVVLMLGVNGAGKTTTIGKLAARYAADGHKVVLGAADTFRAAAVEQLQTWGERVGCDVIAGSSGGDPSAVAFDTVKAAAARGADVAIIDTAGRLQTKKPLMEQLGKMIRVIGRELEGAPHETLLVLDANTGQNAISQARLFTEVAGVTGLVLTKLDGTAKGGVIVGLADEFGIPVRCVGVGEAIEDLRDFSAEEFVEALFER